MTCERFVLRSADRAALVDRAAEHLRAGRLCVLPTETVYGVAALPSEGEAVAAMRALKGSGPDETFPFHLAERSDLSRIARHDDRRVTRLLDRYWPGPLTLVLPGRNSGPVAVRLPAHEFTRAVIARCAEPLWLCSVNRVGEPARCDPDAIEREFGASIALLVDDGPSPLGSRSTVVRCTGPRLEVLREGILSAADVLHTAAAHVLFVCTGNTCRSPLAEGLARHGLAKALGVTPDELLALGIAFGSAGTGTLADMPASDGSIAVAAEIGIDLSMHRSRPFTRSLGEAQDRIYCLSRGHLLRLVEIAPRLADRAELLRPDGEDIADPYGGGLSVYRAARNEIRAAIEARLPQWRELMADGNKAPR